MVVNMMRVMIAVKEISIGKHNRKIYVPAVVEILVLCYFFVLSEKLQKSLESHLSLFGCQKNINFSKANITKLLQSF